MWIHFENKSYCLLSGSETGLPKVRYLHTRGKFSIRKLKVRKKVHYTLGSACWYHLSKRDSCAGVTGRDLSCWRAKQIKWEGPEGVKWELGLAFCCPEKMGFRALGLGFGHWEWEKMSKWEWDKYFWALGSGICKKYGLGNWIGTPTSGPSNELKNENDSSKSKIKTTCFAGKHNEWNVRERKRLNESETQQISGSIKPRNKTTQFLVLQEAINIRLRTLVEYLFGPRNIYLFDACYALFSFEIIRNLSLIYDKHLKINLHLVYSKSLETVSFPFVFVLMHWINSNSNHS